MRFPQLTKHVFAVLFASMAYVVAAKSSWQLKIYGMGLLWLLNISCFAVVSYLKNTAMLLLNGWLGLVLAALGIFFHWQQESFVMQLFHALASSLLVAATVFSCVHQLLERAQKRIELWKAASGSASEEIIPVDSALTPVATQKNILRLLCLLFLTIPLGEGVAFISLALLGIYLLTQYRILNFGVLKQPPLSILLLVLCIWLVRGFLAMGMSHVGWLRPKELGHWLPIVSLPMVALAASQVSHQVRSQVVKCFIVAMVCSCVFALVQYVFDIRPFDNLIRGSGSTSEQFSVPDSETLRTVAGGFYFHRLKMAHVLLLAVGVLLVRQLTQRLSLRRRSVELAILGLFLVTLFLTYTRSAIVGFLLATIILLFFLPHLWKKLVVVGIVGLIVVYLVFPQTLERLMSMQNPSASSDRAMIWSTALKVIEDYPMGVGLGNYPKLIRTYYERAGAPESLVKTYAHNMLLTAWAETGAAGALLFLLLWIYFFIFCFDIRRGVTVLESKITSNTVALIGIFCFFNWMFIGLSHDIWFHNIVLLAYGSMIGLCCPYLRRPNPRREGFSYTL